MLYKIRSRKNDAQKAVYEDIAPHTAALLSLIARQLHADDPEEIHPTANASVQFQKTQGNET